jgi:hypothetical protein
VPINRFLEDSLPRFCFFFPCKHLRLVAVHFCFRERKKKKCQEESLKTKEREHQLFMRLYVLVTRPRRLCKSLQQYTIIYLPFSFGKAKSQVAVQNKHDNFFSIPCSFSFPRCMMVQNYCI